MNLKCSKCELMLPEEKFSKAPNKRGKSYSCKDCHNTYVRETWYKKNSGKHLDSVRTYKKNNKVKILATKYKTTEEVIQALLDYGRCQICGAIENLCIDHCHETGEVRGILCKGCNSALGLLGDDLEGIQRVIDYLIRYAR